MELANIGKSGEITGCDEQCGEDLPTRARRIVHRGDVIVSSVEGSIDSCALVTDEYEGALCSTGFYVLQSSKLNPETLLTLFKSLPIQNLMKKGCSGTILTAIGKSELERIPLPLIRQEVQDEIALHVQKSFELRKEAMQLLENAKLTVETAIENGGGVNHWFTVVYIIRYCKRSVWQLGFFSLKLELQRARATSRQLCVPAKSYRIAS